MSADSPTAPLGRRLLQRAASPGVIRHDVMTRLQRRTSVGGGLAAEIQRRWLPAAPGTWGYGSDLPYFGFGPGAAISHQGFQTPGYPERIVPEGTTPPSRPLQGSVSQRSQGFQSLAATAAKADLPVVQRRSAGSATEPVVQRQAAVPSPTTGIAAGAEAPSGTEEKHTGALRPVRDGHFRSPGFEPGVARGAAGPLVQRKAMDLEPPPPDLTPSVPLSHRPPADRERGRSRERGSVGFGSVREQVLEMGPAIIHRTARGGRVQRRSLATTRAEQVQARRPLFSSSPPNPSPAPVPPVSGSAAETGSVLPLVQTRQLAAGDAGTGSIHHRRTAGSPVQRMVVSPASATTLQFPLARAATPGSVPAFSADLSVAMAGLAMPLARPEAHNIVIQRRESDPAKALRGMATDAVHPPSEALHGMAMDAARPADAEKLDLDEVVERVMRRLTRSLTVESERHGGCR